MENILGQTSIEKASQKHYIRLKNLDLKDRNHTSVIVCIILFFLRKYVLMRKDYERQLSQGKKWKKYFL